MTSQDRQRPPADEAPTSLPTRLSALVREVVGVGVPAGGAASGWDQVLRPGAVVGRFELVRELGRGGFGVVYEARDRATDRLVAFKAVLPGRRVDEAFESLQREADALARLAHPNIVGLHDAGRGEQGPWLSMELLRGQTLSQRLSLGPVPVPEAVRIAVEVARGLGHAHAHGVVHRDLSPRNVYLCHDGQVKLLDMGLAHVFGRRRVAGGTPNYVAPEQWRGAPEDERTDVFSLGVMLFRMLAGEHPVPEDGGTRAHPVPEVEVAGAPALGALVARMLAQDPVERPRDAGEVLEALEAFQGELDRSPTSSTSTPTVRRPMSMRRRRALLGAGALAVALALAVVVGRVAWRAASRTPPSIAVLPFDDLSPGKDQGLFAAGLADEVQGALGAVAGLRVAGRYSAAVLQGKGLPLAEIGRTLGVAAVLEGSVRRSATKIRVTAEIVNVADGFRVWTRTFEREPTDAFDVQEEIASAVVQALDVKLVRKDGSRARERPPPRPEAYTLYLAGKEELRQLQPGGARRAAALLARAVAIDPEFAPAWSSLARAQATWSREARASGEVTSPEAEAALRRQALAAAERAVALDPALPDGWSVRGLLRGELDFDLAGARADVARARALDPNDPATRGRYARLLLAAGQYREAVREARAATALDPLASWWSLLGTTHLAAGDLGRAEAAYRRQLEVLPGGTSVRASLAQVLVLQGRGQEALAMVAQLHDEAGTDRWTEAAAEQALGHAERARAATDAYLAGSGAANEFEAASLLAFTGRRDEAFAWLGKALAARRQAMLVRLGWWPFLEPLHGDPRFAALQREVAALGARASR